MAVKPRVAPASGLARIVGDVQNIPRRETHVVGIEYRTPYAGRGPRVAIARLAGCARK